MLRFPRRLAARFGALVRADPSGVRAGFGALLISSGGDLVAGLTLASINHTLLELPALFVLIPAAIGMRGNVFGALGSRLGTLIHTGEFRVSRRLDQLLANLGYCSRREARGWRSRASRSTRRDRPRIPDSP